MLYSQDRREDTETAVERSNINLDYRPPGPDLIPMHFGVAVLTETGRGDRICSWIYISPAEPLWLTSSIVQNLLANLYPKTFISTTMPVWDFNLTAGSLSAQEKENLAANITNIYTKIGLPAFYVQVRFHEAGPSAMFVGGLDGPINVNTSQKKYVGIQILHLARTFTTEQSKERFLQIVDQTLNPLFKDKGWHWEYFITEGPRELWKINGIYPPATDSALEKKWKEKNEAVDPAVFGASL